MLRICPSFSAAPLTLQSVSTILSAFASVRKGLESNRELFSLPLALGLTRPRDLLVISVMAPNPKPAARPPYETNRLILVAGTFLCLEEAESCWLRKYLQFK